MSVRVRFAPSPTGYLHVGSARSALYNFLFARGRDGVFILRSDDTDRARSTDEFQQDIIEQLQWLGLDWDEGIVKGGPHGTYRQSDRFDRYAEVAHGFVHSGHAYYSFATPDELNDFKQKAREAGTSPAYDGSLEPSVDQVSRRIADGEKAVIRFRVPRPGSTTFHDLVRGDVTFDHAQVDDFVILRSDSSPTYHLASTVDDVDYGITHVTRGEDILSSTPKHILITEAMGATPPTYAHLSLLMGPDGKKLSKRHGHTAMAAYREAGYLPEAMNNYLALLGWGASDDDDDVVSMDDMIRRFDLADVSRNAAVFDTKKLDWMNGVYIRAMDESAFVDSTVPLVEERLGRSLDHAELDRYRRIAPHVQERAKTLAEVPPQVDFLFGDLEGYDEGSWSKVMTTPEAPIALDGANTALAGLTEWTTDAIDASLRAMLEEHELSARKGLQPLRVAISGSTVSPPLFESIEVLGRDATLERLMAARSRIDP